MFKRYLFLTGSSGVRLLRQRHLLSGRRLGRQNLRLVLGVKLAVSCCLVLRRLLRGLLLPLRHGFDLVHYLTKRITELFHHRLLVFVLRQHLDIRRGILCGGLQADNVLRFSDPASLYYFLHL